VATRSSFAPADRIAVLDNDGTLWAETIVDMKSEWNAGFKASAR
jgi:hypothetical protein